MPRIVLDSTVLVSAFLAPRGAAAAILGHARADRVELAISDMILQEVSRVLLTSPHIRQRYHYPDTHVQTFCEGLTQVSLFTTDVPHVSGICRDPNDDMVLACALAAQAAYLVTRDKDLLVVQHYAGVAIVTPEALLDVLRAAPEG